MIITMFPKPVCPTQDNLASVFSKLVTLDGDHITGYNILSVSIQRHVFTGIYRVVFQLAEPMRAHDIYPVSFPDEVDSVECYLQLGDNPFTMQFMGFIIDCGLPISIGRWESSDVARGFALPQAEAMEAYHDEW